jgi:hypothetical protein
MRQIPIAKRVNFRDDASDRWTARFLSPGFQGLSCKTLRHQRGLALSDARKDFVRPSSALRDMHLGSGQKESVSEEALRWESSVFGHGRYAA